MRRYLPGLAMLLVLALTAAPSYAKTGSVRVTFAKAGLVAGAGAGHGVLVFDGREYPFTVYGLSMGTTVGASITRLVGRASYLHQLSDFEGAYTAVGTGGALIGGGGGVSLKNDKGVIIWLHGPKVGLEFASNLSGVRIELEQ
ncbi:hypothetical protein [Bradyrhizobium sp. STM 3562]|uniref:hypothetical protein n=1 Tax=Bradyrhizobium sp. STM 3562 TaxID=578924 RepID=UPI00388EEF63